MNKKSLIGLISFAVIVIACLFLSASYLSGQNDRENSKEITGTNDNSNENQITNAGKASEDTVPDQTVNTSPGNDLGSQPERSVNIVTEEPWLSANPTDAGVSAVDNPPASTETEASNTVTAPQLICDSSAVDYKSYIPEMVTDSELSAALDIQNPSISVDAKAAILFDADTKEIIYYKAPVEAMFPASTVKLLTALIALKWCKEEEQVKIGDEITMIAPDSTKAFLAEGQILTIHNLLEGMLLPSGNDAAYAVAAYVGRKSLDKPKASKEEAIAEFVRLMNEEAKDLGVKNSCFKTPDGYDAIGQYTTAYDMGLIGIEASQNTTITDITQKSSSRNIFISGEDVTWSSTNKLITRYSGQYYSNAIGLKTGTSTMAGRNIIAAAQKDGKKVVCVVMDSTLEGRWEDAIKLLKYGLK